MDPTISRDSVIRGGAIGDGPTVGGQNGPMSTAAVILAAGASKRFGSPKQLARIGGRTLVERAVDTARAADLSPVIVVIPPGIAVPAGVETVVNDDPSAGQSRSLRLGLAALGPEVGRPSFSSPTSRRSRPAPSRPS